MLKFIPICSALSFIFLIAPRVFCEEVTFFKGSINYWEKEKDQEPVVTKNSNPTVVTAKKEEAPVGKSFDWKKVMDPKNDEFFKEGDYTPPAPFMEVARNPNDENIRMWNAYIDKKNQLASRLDQRLQEYAVSHGQKPATVPEKINSQKPESQVPVNQSPSTYQFRLYFDSDCPHCQKMMTTMVELASKGYEVELKQTDDRAIDSQNLPFTVTKATKEELSLHGVTSVPFLLVADLGSKVVYKLNGYKNVSTIFEEINAHTQK